MKLNWYNETLYVYIYGYNAVVYVGVRSYIRKVLRAPI